ncbi:lymphocyte antigen 75-like isoform X2 [Ylistrum balloti]|uniref:lymphocyte antigen 75-like isoform X2 n=1 Tax=Ylistrum balloti TaxID=509963 RepID=UPI002905EA3C|nr:lymphocyte antigen 75-like isoform X2 [Ylistrum balloti]
MRPSRPLCWLSGIGLMIMLTEIIDAGAFGRVKLSFVGVDLLPNSWDEKCSDHDYLTIKNSLGRYASHICPNYHAEQFISFGRGTYIDFHSDKRKDKFRHKGIEIRYEMFDPDNQDCPPGWVRGPENNDGVSSCFHVMRAPGSRVDFESAQKFCGFSNANLVKIESAAVYDFIKRLMYRSRNVTYFWIGLNDIKEEGTFEWIDRSPLMFYNRKEGNSETKNCVVQEVATGLWIPVSCQLKHFYVCEIASMYDASVYRVPKRPAKVDKFEEVSNIIKIVAGVGGSLVLVFLCCCCCYYCCCRESSSDKNNQTTGQSGGQTATQNSIPPLPTVENQAATQNFIPPPPLEPTAPTFSELQPMAPQSYNRYTDGLPSYEECMGLQERGS